MVDEIIYNKFFDFLKSNPVAVLSTVSPTQEPMAATIFFSVDNKLNFYFMTKSFTRKFNNIEQNNKVSLVVGTGNVPVTAQIQGKAEKIVDPEELKTRLDELKNVFTKNEFVGPLFEIVGEENEIIIFKITPSWIRWLDLREGGDNNEFIQILP